MPPPDGNPPQLDAGSDEPYDDDRWNRVRRVALEYIGTGWFLSQVFAVVVERAGLPDAVSDYLLIALGLGFILTLAITLPMSRRRASRPRRRRGFLLTGVLLTAGLAIWFLSGGQPDVRSGESGFVQESRGLLSTSRDVNALFLIHPQQPMLHTGIRVRPGQEISAWAEGRINIGLARLVEAARRGDPAAYEWVGPEGELDDRGEPLVRRDRGRPGRERCLMSRQFPYGALLLLVTPSERPSPAGARQLQPDVEVFLVGEELEATARSGGYLTLAVNDVFLDDETCDPEWFAAGRSPDTFFDDNLGFFSARLQVR